MSILSESEFLLIISPFKDKMFRVARRILVSLEEAEDATQEVLLKLWKLRHKFMDYNSPEAFAMTVTKNWCLDRLKSKQAQWVSWDNPHEKHAIWSPENSMDAQEGVEMMKSKAEKRATEI